MPSTQQPRDWQVVAGMLAALTLAVVACSPAAQATVPPTVTPTATPAPAATAPQFHDGSLPAGTSVLTPFAGMADPSTVCMAGIMPACTEDPADDSISVTLTVPAGYAGAGGRPLILGPAGDTALIILRGSWLYSDPCHSTPPPDVEVGPSVDDFANALADHPMLDATTPVDITLAGYAGKYVDLQLPHDVATCTDNFWPFEPGVYAQGADHRWHLWILDVDGIRVVIQAMDYPHTSAAQKAELQGIVESIEIEP